MELCRADCHISWGLGRFAARIVLFLGFEAVCTADLPHSRGSAHDVFRAVGRSEGWAVGEATCEIARNRTNTDRALSYECAFARLRTLSPGVSKEVQALKKKKKNREKSCAIDRNRTIVCAETKSPTMVFRRSECFDFFCDTRNTVGTI